MKSRVKKALLIAGAVTAVFVVCILALALGGSGSTSSLLLIFMPYYSIGVFIISLVLALFLLSTAETRKRRHEKDRLS